MLRMRACGVAPPRLLTCRHLELHVLELRAEGGARRQACASRSAGAHENEIAIGADGEVRVIRSNGVSEHKVGEFPNRGNPNTIVPQSHTFRVPMNPVPANRPVPLRRGMMFGLAAEAWHAEKRAGRRSRRTIR